MQSQPPPCRPRGSACGPGDGRDPGRPRRRERNRAGNREGNRTGCVAISPQGIAPAQGAVAHERDIEGGVGSGENADDIGHLPTPKFVSDVHSESLPRSVSDVHSESLPRSVSDGAGTPPLTPSTPPQPLPIGADAQGKSVVPDLAAVYSPRGKPRSSPHDVHCRRPMVPSHTDGTTARS